MDSIQQNRTRRSSILKQQQQQQQQGGVAVSAGQAVPENSNAQCRRRVSFQRFGTVREFSEDLAEYRGDASGTAITGTFKLASETGSSDGLAAAGESMSDTNALFGELIPQNSEKAADVTLGDVDGRRFVPRSTSTPMAGLARRSPALKENMHFTFADDNSTQNVFGFDSAGGERSRRRSHRESTDATQALFARMAQPRQDADNFDVEPMEMSTEGEPPRDGLRDSTPAEEPRDHTALAGDHLLNCENARARDAEWDRTDRTDCDRTSAIFRRMRDADDQMSMLDRSTDEDARAEEAQRRLSALHVGDGQAEFNEFEAAAEEAKSSAAENAKLCDGLLAEDAVGENSPPADNRAEDVVSSVLGRVAGSATRWMDSPGVVHRKRPRFESPRVPRQKTPPPRRFTLGTFHNGDDFTHLNVTNTGHQGYAFGNDEEESFHVEDESLVKLRRSLRRSLDRSGAWPSMRGPLPEVVESPVVALEDVAIPKSMFDASLLGTPHRLPAQNSSMLYSSYGGGTRVLEPSYCDSPAENASGHAAANATSASFTGDSVDSEERSSSVSSRFQELDLSVSVTSMPCFDLKHANDCAFAKRLKKVALRNALKNCCSFNTDLEADVNEDIERLSYENPSIANAVKTLNPRKLSREGRTMFEKARLRAQIEWFIERQEFSSLALEEIKKRLPDIKERAEEKQAAVKLLEQHQKKERGMEELRREVKAVEEAEAIVLSGLEKSKMELKSLKETAHQLYLERNSVLIDIQKKKLEQLREELKVQTEREERRRAFEKRWEDRWAEYRRYCKERLAAVGMPDPEGDSGPSSSGDDPGGPVPPPSTSR